MICRAGDRRYFERVPDHVLTVLDEAYFEYVDEPDYPDGIEEYLKPGRGCWSCARSRRSTGLRGFASATGSARQTSSPRSARCRTRSTSPSPRRTPRSRAWANDDEIARRRAADRRGPRAARETCSSAWASGRPRPRWPTSSTSRSGQDARPVFEALLREGVIVRPLAPFGAPGAIRVTVGTSEENDLFAAALERVLETAKTAL